MIVSLKMTECCSVTFLLVHPVPSAVFQIECSVSNMKIRVLRLWEKCEMDRNLILTVCCHVFVQVTILNWFESVLIVVKKHKVLH